MNKINFVSAHVVSEVIEDSLDLLIMWCDERYAYDDRPYEQIPCDEVAAEYLATIACCVNTMRFQADHFVCDSCGQVFSLPAYDPMFGKGQACFRCHMEAKNDIKRMMDMDSIRARLEEDYLE